MLTANQTKFLKALQDCKGLVSFAAEQCGISRISHYNWLKESEEYAAGVEAVNEYTGDWMEHSLLRLVEEGDTAAAIFINKTRNKKRGYTEKHEFDLNNNPISVNFVIGKEAMDKANEAISDAAED